MSTHVIYFLIILSFSDAARILAVFPIPSISHQIVFRPFTRELAQRGHEVVIITTDPAFSESQAPGNLTEIDVHHISYKIWREKVINTARGNNKDIVKQVKDLLEVIISVVDAQLNTKAVKMLLNDKTRQFDIVISEAIVTTALVFSYIYKAPVIQISSFGASIDNYEVMGAPTHPFLYPSIVRQKLNNLSIYDKIKEMYIHYQVEWLYKNMMNKEDEMLRNNFGYSIPSVKELKNNVDMLFLNVHPLFEGIRPVPLGVVYLGGLHQKAYKKLPSELKSYLDASEHGVIYLSFGTNIETTLLPQDKVQILVSTLSKLPYDVLFKWNKGELFNCSQNIKTFKWLPQSDLLRHPKVKLFITQGGLQSTDEAITAGVPLIGIPLAGDQWFNVEKYVYHKIGVRIDIENLTEELLKNGIDTVIKDESYRKNIIKLRERIQDEPMRPLDRAIWWTEYVLRHKGAQHFRAPGANISSVKYFELELMLLLITCVIITVVLIWATISLLKLIFKNYIVVIKTKIE